MNPLFRPAARLVALALGAVALRAAEPAAAKQPDVWAPLRVFVGAWEGEARGNPGAGKSTREYRFVLGGRFLEASNRIAYAPTEKHPQGEVHEDRGLFSYDRATKKFVLRQFHVEGFVNTYALESLSADGKTLTFVSTAIENIAPGWRAREVYTLVGPDEIVETFSLAAPDGEFSVYSETRLKRKPTP